MWNQHFISRMIFCDEASYHFSGLIHRHDVWIWRSKNPYAYVEHECDSPKTNVWRPLDCERVIGPFFLTEITIYSFSCLEILELYALPKTEIENLIFQQDKALPHHANTVRNFLNEKFP